MRILILWADERSPNLGVRTLGAGTVALARRVWPEAEIVFHNFGASTAPYKIGSWTMMAGAKFNRAGKISHWLGDFDVILDTRAGDNFADIYGMQRHMTMSTLVEYAHHAEVPVVYTPQTIGPFNTGFGNMLARRNLKTASFVMARDKSSEASAAKLGRPVDIVTTDSVFALDQPETQPDRDVVLNVSGLLWNPNTHVDSNGYRRDLVALYYDLVASDRKVSLLAHVLSSAGAQNDESVVKEFQRRHAPDAEVLVPQTLAEVRGVLAGAQVVIGSRLHACLNALSVGTPAISLAYSRKFVPLYADLGWPHVIDLRDAKSVVRQVRTILTTKDLRAAVAQVQQGALTRMDEAVGALRGSSALP